MSAAVETVGPCKKRLKVQVGPEAVKAEIDEHMRKMAVRVQLPGFRRGHAPQALLEKRIGAQVAEEARDHLISETYHDALKEHKLEPIGEPALDKVEFDPAKGLTYEAILEVRPEFELPPTAGIAMTRKGVQVSDPDLEAGLAELRAQHIQWAGAPAGTALKRGDLALCDLAILEGERRAWEQKGAGVLLDEQPLGDLPTGPADKLLEGYKAGEAREVVATLPDDFPRESLRGKMVTVVVAVREVQHSKLPELDDAFAAALGLKDLPELKERVRKHLLHRKEAEAQRRLEEDLVTHLIAQTPFELPQDALEAHAADALRHAAVDLLMQGVPEKQVQSNLEKLKTGSREWAERKLRASFILAKIAEREKVFVTESDVADQVRQIAASRGERPEAVIQKLEKEGGMGALRASLRQAKVVALLLSKARIGQ